MATSEDLCIQVQAGQNRQEALDLLYRQNIGLLNQIASRFTWGAEREDLLQEAYFALVQAAEHYDPELGAFSTLLGLKANHRLRRYCQISSRAYRLSPAMQDRAYRLRELETEAARTTGEPLSDETAAGALGITQKQLGDLRRWIRESSVVRLDAPIGDEDEDRIGDLTAGAGDLEREVLEDVAHEQATALLRDALTSLPERQREILYLVYFDELTIEEAGRHLGLGLKESVRNYRTALSRLRRSCRDICGVAADLLEIRMPY